VSLVLEGIKQAFIITCIIFSMLLIVDLINIVARGLERFLKRSFKQYLLASFLGTIPGCLGVFMNVSFYTHGLISFGALVSGMIATCGDEAFVMLFYFPKRALLLFAILFVSGIIFGWIMDLLVLKFHLKVADKCKEVLIHEKEYPWIIPGGLLKIPKYFSLTRFLLVTAIGGIISLTLTNILKVDQREMIMFVSSLVFISIAITVTHEHYLKEHILKHIVINHLPRIFLWVLIALIIVNLLPKIQELPVNPIGLIFISALIGIIPASGIHLVFVIMVAKGLAPFSVLLTNSIVQEGHGLLPLLSHSIRDSLAVKGFKIIIGIILGLIFYGLGS
jgi:hypothetical protein